MKDNEYLKNVSDGYIIVTAGSAYLDIDAYACSVAMAELLCLKGKNAVAYSKAPCNYSVCSCVAQNGQIKDKLPDNCDEALAKYIIVDVSDPDFIGRAVPLNNIVAVYDHHTGFENYWSGRIGDNSHIEFIGAAATLIYREWKNNGLQDKIKSSTARLLIAAILDNTLNLTSLNTTPEDIEAFNELCIKENIDNDWCAAYFSQVQASVEADLKNALFGDIKTVSNNDILPSKVAQICVWNAKSILEKLSEIRQWFRDESAGWMINLIDIKHHCCYFICDDAFYQEKLENIFDIRFVSGVAKTSVTYLRKEIIKKTINIK